MEFMILKAPKIYVLDISSFVIFKFYNFSVTDFGLNDIEGTNEEKTTQRNVKFACV